MDYAEARAAFFNPRADEDTVPPSESPTLPRALRDAIEPIATICFWSEPASTAYAAIGLDFLGGYIWGRASVLGEPSPGVVASAFGVFEPAMIAEQYTQGREIASLSQIRNARAQGSTTALTETIGRPEELADVVATLRRAVDAGDTTARPMFAGVRDLPWPQDQLTALWHATTALREFRGDTHLAACAAAGLSGLEANVLTEVWIGWEKHAYTATRGWSPEDMERTTETLRDKGLLDGETLSEPGRALRESIENTTDERCEPLVEALGGDVDELITTLRGWSDKIVDAGWFPPDPYKRASG